MRRRTARPEKKRSHDSPPHGRSYSALIPAARITLPHLSVSLAISLPQSAAEPVSSMPPMSASRDLMVASASPALISRLSVATTSGGVAFGAATPNHELASNPL